jgi:hypothetical protein
MEVVHMKKQIELMGREAQGRVFVPILLAIGGVPLGLVLLIWFFFFRG